MFEDAGIATVVLASIRQVAERMRVPRALYCEFPLGRPLGVPGDAGFQTEVLQRAFALLDRSGGPVLEDHPTAIEADEQPMSCALPPRFDPDLPASVDEARGLRKAHDRSVARRGVTNVGRTLGPDDIAHALEQFERIVDGESSRDVDLPGGDPISAVHDIRAYYEEAALELVNGPAPGGRAAEAWFFEETEAGKTIMTARRTMRDAEVAFPVWFYMAPAHRM